MKEKIVGLFLVISCLMFPLFLSGCSGTNGIDGKDGKSAYEIAVDNGFVGTEAEWLESLKGKDGVDGKDYEPEVKTYTLSFDYNLGKYLDDYDDEYTYYPLTKTAGEPIGFLPDATWSQTKAGGWATPCLSKYFLGWFTGNTVNDTHITKYSVLNEDATLYARWNDELLQQDLYSTDGLEFDTMGYFNSAYVKGYSGSETSVKIPRLIINENKTAFSVINEIDVGGTASGYLSIKELKLSSENFISEIGLGCFQYGDLTIIDGDISGVQNITSETFKGTPFLTSGIADSKNNIFIHSGIVIDGKSTTATNVELKNIHRIAEGAFQDNTIIEKVIINSSNDNLVIADYSFANCSKLKEIVVNDVRVFVKDYAFENCSALEIANMSVSDLGVSSFKNTALKEFVVEQYQTFLSYNEDLPFDGNTNVGGLTLIVKSENFIEDLKLNNATNLLNYMKGVGKIIINTEVEISEDSLLNNSLYFTKDGNVYTWVYISE